MRYPFQIKTRRVSNIFNFLQNYNGKAVSFQLSHNPMGKLIRTKFHAENQTISRPSMRDYHDNEGTKNDGDNDSLTATKATMTMAVALRSRMRNTRSARPRGHVPPHPWTQCSRNIKLDTGRQIHGRIIGHRLRIIGRGRGKPAIGNFHRRSAQRRKSARILLVE